MTPHEFETFLKIFGPNREEMAAIQAQAAASAGSPAKSATTGAGAHS